MRYIIVGIEAGEKECGECPNMREAYGQLDHFEGWACCLYGDLGRKVPIVRTPACLEAEAKFKALVEAGEKAQALISKLNNWCWPNGDTMISGHRAKISKMIDDSGAWPALAEALAALKGE